MSILEKPISKKGKKGSKHNLATMTEEIALEIFQRANSGDSFKDIQVWAAENYALRLTKSNVSNIKHKRSWKHIHNEQSPVWAN